MQDQNNTPCYFITYVITDLQSLLYLRIVMQHMLGIMMKTIKYVMIVSPSGTKTTNFYKYINRKERQLVMLSLWFVRLGFLGFPCEFLKHLTTCRVLRVKLIIPHLVKKFTTFYGTWIFRNVTASNLVEVNQYFGKMYHLRLQGLRVNQASRMLLVDLNCIYGALSFT
jgi:hypothetical protein